MSKYLNALRSERFHIQSLRIVIFILLFVVSALGFALYSVPKNLTIHNPPDLRSGSTRAWWEIPTPNVYGFAFYIFQQLNRWPTDGEVDYQKNIEALRPYLTPSCYQFLLKDYDNRNLLGELRERVRGVYEMPGREFSESRVKINSQDNWDVTLDLYTDEYYKDEPVKRVLVRYPLNVVRFDVNPEQNPWGMALNCYRSTPQRIELSKPDDKSK
ncbi:integrating conjugative element protein [Haemophilus paracuniculus]|uniref:Integrating conjugative element protein n=1 Tax=Haemophilus paracuniculus TaxID=734 RepID=A0A1T0AW56_9PAST|nr:TIGR03746 family integrating conjugative element protein [Haemophilus paracuniculus]OOS00876.1 integrating conjugative element protein [Haemophilus paracuniculus]